MTHAITEAQRAKAKVITKDDKHGLPNLRRV